MLASSGEAWFNTGTAASFGVQRQRGYFRGGSLTGSGRVAWIVRVVKIGGSSSISVQACAAFGGQDAELTTLSALRAQALRGRHGTGQQLLI
jgi:hypothetical protein